MLGIEITAFIVSQILVWIAIVTDFVSFQFKDRKKVLIWLTISSTLITIHYLLLGQINAFFLLTISTFSFLVSAFTHDKRVMYLFFLFYLLPVVLNYQEASDLFIFVWLYIILFAKFQKNDKYIRLWIMLWITFVIAYNIVIFTPMWVLLEVLFLGSNVIWFYKHYLRGER